MTTSLPIRYIIQAPCTEGYFRKEYILWERGLLKVLSLQKMGRAMNIAEKAPGEWSRKNKSIFST
jgi:hypothetical protein